MLEKFHQRANYRLAMSAGPIDLVTRWATLELRLGLEHKGGDPVTHLVAWYLFQDLIAGEAAGKDTRKSRCTRDLEDLLELRLNILLFEKYKVLHDPSHQQACVAR